MFAADARCLVHRPYRLFVPDQADPTKLHAYFSGCQGRHADIHSTLPGERFAEMREEWVSYGAWGYTNVELGSKASKELCEYRLFLPSASLHLRVFCCPQRFDS